MLINLDAWTYVYTQRDNHVIVPRKVMGDQMLVQPTIQNLQSQRHVKLLNSHTVIIYTLIEISIVLILLFLH
jgi:hypothetical protein